MEERLTRSMLRARHASQIAAEENLVQPEKIWGDELVFDEALLYRSPDYTNFNVWESFTVLGAYIYIIAGSYCPNLALSVSFPLSLLSKGMVGFWRASMSLLYSFSRWIIIGIGAISNFLRARFAKTNLDVFTLESP
jgi:hypothetical protein